VADLFIGNGFYDQQDLVQADIAEFQHKEKLNAGQLSFVKRYLNKVNAADTSTAATSSAGAAGSGGAADCVAQALALIQQAHHKPNSKSTINLAAEINKLSLHGTSPDTWPSAKLTEELKEESDKAAAKGGGLKAFTYVDLGKKCMPSWCPVPEKDTDEDVDTLLQEEGSASVQAVAKALNRATKQRSPHLSLHVWTAAFHKYALAAAAAGQLQFSAALAHLDSCLRVADQARAGGRTPALASVYDEVVRKKWSQRTESCFPGFNVNAAALTFDKEALSAAESLYDRRGKKKEPRPRAESPRGRWYGKRYGYWGSSQPTKRWRH
jgi:hypothetical protein